jgi:hypothetical protein
MVSEKIPVRAVILLASRYLITTVAVALEILRLGGVVNETIQDATVFGTFILTVAIIAHTCRGFEEIRSPLRFRTSATLFVRCCTDTLRFRCNTSAHSSAGLVVRGRRLLRRGLLMPLREGTLPLSLLNFLRRCLRRFLCLRIAASLLVHCGSIICLLFDYDLWSRTWLGIGRTSRATQLRKHLVHVRHLQNFVFLVALFVTVYDVHSVLPFFVVAAFVGQWRRPFAVAVAFPCCERRRDILTRAV